jgi:hypothetical protein
MFAGLAAIWPNVCSVAVAPRRVFAAKATMLLTY